MKISFMLNSVLNAILNLIFPKLCLGCKTPAGYLCGNCLKELSLLKFQSCPSCRKLNDSGMFCNKWCAKDYFFDQLLICLPYDKDSIFKKLIVAYKYKFSEEISEILGKVMESQFTKFLHTFSDKQIIITPVPLHKKRINYRGFNQAGLLALYLSERFNNLEFYDCLQRKFFTEAQAKLEKSLRLKNVKDSILLKKYSPQNFSFEDFIKGKTILLIDDVATTCSTLNECSRALKEAGAKYICGLVLARGFKFC